MPQLGEVKTKFTTESDSAGIDAVEKRILGFSQKTVDASKAVALGLLAIGAGAIAMGKTSFDAFTAQEDAIVRLQTGINNVKSASDKGIEGLLEYASALQKTTRFADEEITSAHAMLTTFQLNQGTIKSLTPGMLDMAEAFRKTTGETIDLNQISVLFGKVMGGASEGIDGMAGSLKKMGVIMTEEQKAVFKFGTEQERASTLASIMDLNFKGFAEGGAQTASGKLAIMTNQFGEIQESIGGLVANAIGPLVSSLSENLVPTFEKMGEFMKNNKDLFLGLGIVLATIVTPAFVSWGIAAAGAALSTLIALAPLILLGAAIALMVIGLKNAWESNFLGIRDIVAGVVEWFQAYVAPVFSVWFEIMKFQLTILWNVFMVVFAAIRAVVEILINWLVSTFAPRIKAVWDGVSAGLRFLKGLWDSNWGGMRDTVTTIASQVTSTVRNMVSAVVGFFNGLIRGANKLGGKVPGWANIPEIPGLASGTNRWRGGMAMVGERGPELVNLPRNSQVIPNNQLGGALAPAITMNNNIYNDIDMQKAITELGWELRRG